MKCFLTIIVLSLSACSGEKKTIQQDQKTVQKETVQAQTINKQDESFDPFSLNDRWRILPKEKNYGIKPYTENNSDIPVSDHKETWVLGYRIQLFSTKDYYEAVAQRDLALTKFTEDVYLDFEPPYYKLRIGNFTDKTSADEIKEFAKSVGYADAWVIQTKVLHRE